MRLAALSLAACGLKQPIEVGRTAGPAAFIRRALARSWPYPSTAPRRLAGLTDRVLANSRKRREPSRLKLSQ